MRSDVAALADRLAAADDLVLLVNNAGFGTRGEFVEVALERTLDMIRVHVLATVTLCRAAAPGMMARGGGAIVNVSSIAAFFPSAGGANYGATKAYLNAFSEALAAELRGAGVAVQALCPGFTTTEFHDVGDYEAFDRGQIPVPLWMPAADVVAESLAALGSGRVIVVPGGQVPGHRRRGQQPAGQPHPAGGAGRPVPLAERVRGSRQGAKGRRRKAREEISRKDAKNAKLKKIS